MRILRIHGIAQCLQCHHKGVTLRIVNINMPLIFRVAQNIKALLLHILGVHVVVVINNADTAPEIRHRIGIFGIIGQIHNLRCQVVQVGNQIQIQLLQGILRHHSLNHVIRRNHHIIGIPRLQLGIHHLIGIEKFRNYLYPVFLFKVRNQILTHIFSGDIQL